MYNQVIVVEGKHDEQKIKSIFPNVECIVTGGSSISEETLNLIYQTSLKKEVILFLDPDFPGKQITNKILETKGSYKIAFINKEKAISKNRRKVGIEHASKKDIIASLESYFTVNNETDKILIKDLMNRKLINYDESKIKRIKLCKALNIPPLNGKALLKTLNLLCISLERVDEIIG
ncbi:ribonuclease M5 [Mycoplasmatota bacterium WC30]